MPSIQDVADLAGVSTATVSRALSGKGTVSAATRERVAAAADELGYVVSSNASSLATGRTKNVGVVIPALNSLVLQLGARGRGAGAALATATTSPSTTSAAAARSGAACSSTSCCASGWMP